MILLTKNIFDRFSNLSRWTNLASSGAIFMYGVKTFVHQLSFENLYTFVILSSFINNAEYVDRKN